MSEYKTKMTYAVSARRIDDHGSLAHCKEANINLDTDLTGCPDAFNPAELLMASLAACMIKGIEREAPILNFELRGVKILSVGLRQDEPPKMEFIDYEILVDSDENDHRLELLHEKVKKYSTIFNTVAPGTELKGVLLRDIRSD
ncbi:OsmC family protein [Vreelandella sulfidaeris]|uniref:OsmC family protein n=1 Tax=Vreelandella sulfidaeris TaxID=115553 RepID=UPI0035EDA386